MSELEKLFIEPDKVVGNKKDINNNLKVLQQNFPDNNLVLEFGN